MQDLFDAVAPARPCTPPLKWHGGKHYVAPQVLALMPPHLSYVEPYFGSGQVLFRRDPGDRRLWWTGRDSDGRVPRGVSEMVNDLDGNLMNFYRVLKTPPLKEQLLERLNLTLVSQEEFASANELLAGTDGRPVERAAALFVQVRQSRQALRKDFATPSTGRLRGGRQEAVNSWWSAVDGLEDAHRRIRDVMVLRRPALDVIRQFDLPETLFYLDPPYVPETRTARSAYGRFEMSEADHRDLLDVLGGVKGKVILSGYQSALYDGALSSWTRHTFDLPNNAAGGKRKGRETEVLWCNF
jgi:DNA adenine methylase